MKILVIFTYAPLPPPHDVGGHRRNIPIFLELAKRYDVSVLSYGTAREEQIFRHAYGHLCSKILFLRYPLNIGRHFLDRLLGWMLGRTRDELTGSGFVPVHAVLWNTLLGRSRFRRMANRRMQRAVDRMAAREHFDLVHCTNAHLANLRFPQGVRVAGDAHNVEYDLAYRTYKQARQPLWKLLNYRAYKIDRKEEPATYRRLDALITTTERDAKLLRPSLPPRHVHVVQSGVGEEFFDAPRCEEEPRSLVFTGGMGYFPNSEGIFHFLDRIFPLILAEEPRARLYVVGRDPSAALRARAGDRVVVTGFVEDVRPYIARAELFVIPLLTGGGMRGKALDAMAMEKPIVTTRLGCEGIRLRHGESAWFADSPEDFASGVLKLFRDPSLRVRLAAGAKASARAHYHWSQKGLELESLYESLVGAARAN